MRNIYTLGYLNFLSSDFQKIVKDKDAYIVDIRFSNYSFMPFWTGNYLLRNFNNRYVHLKELGNKNYKNENLKIEIFDAENGIKRIKKLLERNDIILCCSCRDYSSCHRKIVSGIIKDKLGIETKEIIENF